MASDAVSEWGCFHCRIERLLWLRCTGGKLSWLISNVCYWHKWMRKNITNKFLHNASTTTQNTVQTKNIIRLNYYCYYLYFYYLIGFIPGLFNWITMLRCFYYSSSVILMLFSNNLNDYLMVLNSHFYFFFFCSRCWFSMTLLKWICCSQCYLTVFAGFVPVRLHLLEGSAQGHMGRSALLSILWRFWTQHEFDVKNMCLST